MTKENSFQLMDDWTDSSMITIDGVDFAPIGFDSECGFSDIDLKNGLQLRIHNAVKKIANALEIIQ